jgi:hypothetical protein
MAESVSSEARELKNIVAEGLAMGAILSHAKCICGAGSSIINRMAREYWQPVPGRNSRIILEQAILERSTFNMYKSSTTQFIDGGLILLAMAAFLSAAADRLLQLKLGSISLFAAPQGDIVGTGIMYMLLPMALLLTPIAMFFNNGKRRLKYLQSAMLLKALLAMVFSLDLTRQFLSDGGHRVGYSLSLIFLAGEWTVICVVLYLSQRAARPLLYLSVLGACYFLGQTAALLVAPHVVSRPFSNTFAAAVCLTYLVAYYAARGCKAYDFAGGVEAGTNLHPVARAENQTGLGRLLAATTILYTPLYVGLIMPLFYALQGFQVGTLTFASLTAKGALAFAIGAAASLALHRLASRRRVLQLVAAATTGLSLCGALSYNYDFSMFTLMAVLALAGFITPDWENHLLSIVPSQNLGPFMAARNTLVMVLIALLSPPVERTLPAVSALYVLKEFNIIILCSALVATVVAPLLLARKMHAPASFYGPSQNQDQDQDQDQGQDHDAGKQDSAAEAVLSSAS